MGFNSGFKGLSFVLLPRLTTGKRNRCPWLAPLSLRTLCGREKNLVFLEIESRYLSSPALCLMPTLDVAAVMSVWYKYHTNDPVRFLAVFFTWCKLWPATWRTELQTSAGFAQYFDLPTDRCSKARYSIEHSVSRHFTANGHRWIWWCRYGTGKNVDLFL